MGDPAAIPLGVPVLDVALAIFVSFKACLLAYESALNRSRCRLARQRRKAEPHLVFQDMRDAPSCPVSTLVEGSSGVVAEVDSDEAALVFTEPVTWDVSQKIHVQGQVHDIIYAEEDKVWLDPAPVCQPGSVATQETLVGDLVSLFRAFGTEWTQRWMKHSDTEPAEWNRLIAEAASLPQQPEVSFPALAVDEWRAAVARKKPRTAGGFDGLMRQDFLDMPSDLLQHLLSICEEAEATGRWPSQALQAVVTALEKRPDSSRVQHYRPITVLSLFYRTWASIQSRHCLGHLAHFAGDGLRGCLPGRSAAGLWYELQTLLEEAGLSATPKMGIIADLSKAFNNIPRIPTFALARRLGLPQGLLRGWLGALTGLARRFKVRVSIGPSLFSVTGFPEGDPLSCTAMVLVDLAYHRAILARVPQAIPFSFVDDLNFDFQPAESSPVTVPFVEPAAGPRFHPEDDPNLRCCEYAPRFHPAPYPEWRGCAPFESSQMTVLSPQAAFQEIFSDGSCIFPTEPHLSLASWALVPAKYVVGVEAVVLEAGILPGWLQTAYRAELYAALAALCYANRARRPVRLWSDCQGVVGTVQGFLFGDFSRVDKSPSRNLLRLLACEVQRLQVPFQVCWVPSHVEWQRCPPGSLGFGLYEREHLRRLATGLVCDREVLQDAWPWPCARVPVLPGYPRPQLGRAR